MILDDPDPPGEIEVVIVARGDGWMDVVNDAGARARIDPSDVIHLHRMGSPITEVTYCMRMSLGRLRAYGLWHD